jgi:hypothetical protein
MRKLIVVGLFLACVGVAPSTLACDARGTNVVIMVTPPSTTATSQSQGLLADATRLDGKADTEEAASNSVLASAAAKRKRAAAIRVQAFQVSEPSRGAVLARADKLDAEAAVHEAASVTFLARARAIRSRARSLRALSTRVLASGAVTSQVLARVQLPAPPAGHPDPTALRALDAAPRTLSMPVTFVAGI